MKASQIGTVRHTWAVALFFLVSVPRAENIYFPHTTSAGQDISGVIDVTKPPYNADNSGATDVTAVLQRVIDENQGNFTFYFPNGTYLVSNTLQCKTCINYCTGTTTTRGPVFQGQSRAGTVIRLQDGTWPNGNEGRAVIHTGNGIAQNFDRGIYNLTVDIGSNNAGAWGVFWYSNNQGMMSDVDIVSRDGQGLVGLHLGPDNEQGPTMVRRTRIQGFRTGVDYGGGLNGSVTLCQITLEDQSEYGIIARAKALYIDSLTSVNQVPALYVQGWATVVLDNAHLTGGSGNNPAVRVDGKLFARHVVAQGYQRAISGGSAPAGVTVEEYSSHGIKSLFTSPQRSMNLPVKYPPLVPWEEDTTKWANPLLYKGGLGQPQRSDCEALQEAIDDPTKTTVVVPVGKAWQFASTDTLYVRGNISRIVGTPGSISGGTVCFTEGTAPAVKMSRITGNTRFVHRASRTLVLESILGGNNPDDIQARGTGDFFLSDIVAQITVDSPNQRVWVWHYDAEWSNGGNLYVKAGKCRMFGWKTEGAREKVHVEGGALELLGFYAYAQLPSPQSYPLITVHNNAQFCIAGLHQVTFGNAYTNLVRETRDGVTRDFTTSQNGGSGDLTLYVGYDDTTLSVAATTPAPETRHKTEAATLNCRVSGGTIHLDCRLPRMSEVSAAVHDALGHAVRTVEHEGSNNRLVSLQIPAMQPGVYFVRVRAGGTRLMTKAVVKGGR